MRRLIAAGLAIGLLVSAGCGSSSSTTNGSAAPTTGSSGSSGGHAAAVASSALGSSAGKTAAQLTITTTPSTAMWGASAACGFAGAQGPDAPGARPANEGIDGVVAFDKPVQTHVQGCVDYPVAPSVGGPHNPVWSNCGFYSSPVPEVHAVHDLEHGAVWIAFAPDLPAAQLDALRALTGTSPLILTSPFPGLRHPVVVTAWARQLTLDQATDPRLARFVQQYLQGPTTPEVGAPCTGGLGHPG